MSAIDLTLINVGGPCKITDGSAVFYSEGDVVLDPQPVYRSIAGSLAGEADGVLTDLTWKISFTPKAIWDATTRGVLLPTAYTNFTATGARIIGAVNRTVTVLGADGEQYVFTRAQVTKMPSLYLGLGKALYDGVEYTGFIGHGKDPADADAFYSQSTGVTWSQTGYPTGHQEALCTAAWGSVTGWTTLYAEEGFLLSHDLALEPVKQGNITVDLRITGYRARVAFRPQGPTSAQLLAALGLQGSAMGIGTRLSSGTRANDLVITGSGIAVTAHKVSVDKGQFAFSNKLNRLGEIEMVTALTAPGTRLTLA